MSNQNLYSNEARAKISEMVESIDFAMMATDLGQTPLHMVPMSTKKVDSQGTIWFLSNRNSTHNQNILKDGKLHLIYVDKSEMQFLNVYGTATITNDKQIIHELYGKADDTWFEGEHDPNITAIAVKPSDAAYWDPKGNKLITLLKMGVGALTGDEPDLMDHGAIKL